MPHNPHVVTFRVKETGKEFHVWDEVRITHDMMQPGSAWTLAMWRSAQTEESFIEVRQAIKLGTRIQILIDGALQLDGRVETIHSQTEEGGQVIGFSGRDLSATVIDSEIDPATSVKGRTVQDAIETVLVPYTSTGEIKFSVCCDAEAVREVSSLQRQGPRGSGATKKPRRTKLDKFRIRPGQKGWEIISAIADHAGCLIWTGPCDDGTAIILDTPEQNAPPLFRLRRTNNGTNRNSYLGNIIATSHRYNIQGIPTAFTTSTSGGGRSDLVNTSRTGWNAEITTSKLVEPGLENWNRKYLDVRRMKSLDDANKLIERYVAQCNRDFVQFNCVVEGFGQAGVLYAVNTRAWFTDVAEEPVIDANLLITKVSFVQSRERGQMSEISLTYANLLAVKPENAELNGAEETMVI